MVLLVVRVLESHLKSLVMEDKEINELRGLRLYMSDRDSFWTLCDRNILPVILFAIKESSFLVPWKNTMINVHGFSPEYGTWNYIKEGKVDQFKKLYREKLESRDCFEFLVDLYMLKKLSWADGIAIICKRSDSEDPVREVLEDWINSKDILDNPVIRYEI